MGQLQAVITTINSPEWRPDIIPYGQKGFKLLSSHISECVGQQLPNSLSVSEK